MTFLLRSTLPLRPRRVRLMWIFTQYAVPHWEGSPVLVFRRRSVKWVHCQEKSDSLPHKVTSVDFLVTSETRALRPRASWIRSCSLQNTPLRTNRATAEQTGDLTFQSSVPFKFNNECLRGKAHPRTSKYCIIRRGGGELRKQIKLAVSAFLPA